MANTSKPFSGRLVVISENTTTGKYEIDVYNSGVSITGGTAASTQMFDDTTAGQAAYRAALLKLLTLPS